MKKSIIEKLKENQYKVKDTDLTRLQTIVIDFILTGNHWMLTKSDIAEKTHTSRVTVDRCFNILEVIYSELEEEK